MVSISDNNITMKRCTKCKKEKSLEEFRIRKDGKFGRTSQCRICMNIYGKEYSSRYHVKIRKSIQGKEWKEKNKDYCRQRSLKYYYDNKAHVLEYMKKRKENSIQYKLTCILRDRLYKAIKGNYKSGSAVRDLGCSMKFFKKYLQSKFYLRSKTDEIMTWSNHTRKGWHIDHIRPLSSFDLTNRQQFLRACHYTNLQPLWAEENFAKSGSYV